MLWLLLAHEPLQPWVVGGGLGLRVYFGGVEMRLQRLRVRLVFAGSFRFSRSG